MPFGLWVNLYLLRTVKGCRVPARLVRITHQLNRYTRCSKNRIPVRFFFYLI